MKIVKISEVSDKEESGGLFVGTVTRKTLVSEAIGAKDLRLDIITFPPRARNKLHTHTYDQVLYILSGRGIIATQKEETVVEPGMLAFIPAGEKHWHGASRDSSFSHISILKPGKTVY